MADSKFFEKQEKKISQSLRDFNHELATLFINLPSLVETVEELRIKVESLEEFKERILNNSLLEICKDCDMWENDEIMCNRAGECKIKKMLKI